MDLPTYIRAQGVAAVADRFGVSRHAACSWLYGKRLPKPKKAAEIELKTKGLVTMREIFATKSK